MSTGEMAHGGFQERRAVDRRWEEHERRLSEHERIMTTLEGRLDNMVPKIEVIQLQQGLKGEMQQLASKIDRLADGFEDLTQTFKEITKRQNDISEASMKELAQQKDERHKLELLAKEAEIERIRKEKEQSDKAAEDRRPINQLKSLGPFLSVFATLIFILAALWMWFVFGVGQALHQITTNAANAVK